MKAVGAVFSTNWRKSPEIIKSLVYKLQGSLCSPFYRLANIKCLGFDTGYQNGLLTSFVWGHAREFGSCMTDLDRLAINDVEPTRDDYAGTDQR